MKSSIGMSAFSHSVLDPCFTCWYVQERETVDIKMVKGHSLLSKMPIFFLLQWKQGKKMFFGKWPLQICRCFDNFVVRQKYCILSELYKLMYTLTFKSFNSFYSPFLLPYKRDHKKKKNNHRILFPLCNLCWLNAFFDKSRLLCHPSFLQNQNLVPILCHCSVDLLLCCCKCQG